jgi:GMP synthase-like glutamine amidotransferase
MRILIVENFHATHHGQVGAALTEADAEIILCRMWDGGNLPPSPDGYDGLVVFGGEQSAVDDDSHPYLADLVGLMRAFGEEDKAVLGICLGSQLLARAWGGQNLLGSAEEFGWRTVSRLDQAETDPVMQNVSNAFPIFEWHSDTFTLPDGAVRLASNDVAENQCFRIGRASYGMQFHFEANSDAVASWNSTFADTVERISPGWLVRFEETRNQFGPQADATGLAIARAWVKLV